jgi:hypothetical protein
MLDTPPAAIIAPKLAQAPVATLLEHFAATLSWLSDGYGLVQTGTANDGKSKIPQLYRQDGGLDHIDVYPDEKMKALTFFERNGPSTVEWDDPQHLSGTWTHSYASVMWLNLPKIDKGRDYDFTEELIQDFLMRGLRDSPLSSRLTFEEAEQRSERIFSRYTNWPLNKQLLMHPFSGFRVPFSVTQPVDTCPAPFEPGGIGGGPFLIANGLFLRVNL